jgi:hypothetical protein
MREATFACAGAATFTAKTNATPMNTPEQV